MVPATPAPVTCFRDANNPGLPLAYSVSVGRFDSETLSVSLIDETEQDYYVLHGSGSAMFISRNLVEQVEFLGIYNKWGQL